MPIKVFIHLEVLLFHNVELRFYFAFLAQIKGKKHLMLKLNLFSTKCLTKIHNKIQNSYLFESVFSRWTSGSHESLWIGFYNLYTSECSYFPPIFFSKVLTPCQAAWTLWVNTLIKVQPQIVCWIEIRALIISLPSWYTMCHDADSPEKVWLHYY